MVLMRILPASRWMNAFAALQNINWRFHRSSENFPVENFSNQDENNLSNQLELKVIKQPDKPSI